ncbi:MAG TPA: hypothetical protein PK867_28195 [Pirellulales bacterium]|nr:hypothetical protein [Pirellulales bacterium]
MMLLADWEIVLAIARGHLVVTPLIDAAKQIGSSSIDLRLGTEFSVIRRLMRSHFDVKQSRDEIEREVR